MHWLVNNNKNNDDAPKNNKLKQYMKNAKKGKKVDSFSGAILWQEWWKRPGERKQDLQRPEALRTVGADAPTAFCSSVFMKGKQSPRLSSGPGSPRPGGPRALGMCTKGPGKASEGFSPFHCVFLSCGVWKERDGTANVTGNELQCYNAPGEKRKRCRFKWQQWRRRRKEFKGF